MLVVWYLPAKLCQDRLPVKLKLSKPERCLHEYETPYQAGFVMSWRRM